MLKVTPSPEQCHSDPVPGHAVPAPKRLDMLCACHFCAFPQNQPVHFWSPSPQMKKPKAQRWKPLLKFFLGLTQAQAPQGVCSALPGLVLTTSLTTPGSWPTAFFLCKAQTPVRDGTKALFQAVRCYGGGLGSGGSGPARQHPLSCSSAPRPMPLWPLPPQLGGLHTRLPGLQFHAGSVHPALQQLCPGELHCIHGQDGKMGRAGPTHGNHLVAGVVGGRWGQQRHPGETE